MADHWQKLEEAVELRIERSQIATTVVTCLASMPADVRNAWFARKFPPPSAANKEEEEKEKEEAAFPCKPPKALPRWMA